MFKKNTKGPYFYSRWAYKWGGGGGGLYPGGFISGIIYSFENGWAYIRGGLKSVILWYIVNTFPLLALNSI